ncbi:hypothetical protein M3P05_18860 [Sansalvadorimonas sp. 2012CJ34-2]|uniref:Uncharacterized protein n=1 Tax=Parendozoicomonas callyspongiae TaxID=2942213 RepID=A0ABT0PKR6_9GAMM|nr:hypothetical protein [Sansalvadorimonas sp. 2012CJ34-2]MCL6271985.1 hypothetical protein [Sansalvadorimonas sp. 2012CJ34-2]
MNLARHALTIPLLLLLIPEPLAADTLSLEGDGFQRVADQIRSIPPSGFSASGQGITENPSIQVDFDYRSNIGIQAVSVTERLPARILKNGEETGTSIFLATVENQPALLTLGDQGIQLSHTRFDGVSREATFTEIDELGIEETILTGESTQHANLEQLALKNIKPTESFQPSAQTSNNASNHSQTPLIVHAFKHTELPKSDSYLFHRHFGWWIKHMSELNQSHQHNGNQSIFSEIIINWASDKTIQNMPHQTRYENKQASTAKDRFLEEFRKHIADWNDKQKSQTPATHTKFLLLVRYGITARNPAIHNGIEDPHYEAILEATDPKYQIGFVVSRYRQFPAYSLGVLMGGSQKYAETKYKFPWFCETIIADLSEFRSNCYEYSLKNRKLIIDHLL